MTDLRGTVNGEQPRILHVLWALEDTGAPVFQLVREQRRRGVEADVLVGSGGGFYAERTRETGAHVHELAQRRAFDVTVLRRARRLFREYPIIHFHSREPLLIAAAARERGPRLYYTHRGGNHYYPLRKRLRHRIIGRYLRRRFDGIAANTIQGARAAAHIYKLPLDSVRVIYNGLDFSLVEPRRPRDAVLSELDDRREEVVRIGTAAFLRPLKRVDRLLRALTELTPEEAHCYVIGDGPARDDLERLAVTLGLAEQVSFLGHKTTIGDYLQALDVFTLPSGPEESFGNALVEAMGMGIPALVFADGGGLTEHIAHRVTGIVASSQEDFAVQLVELVRNKELRTRLGEAGRVAVRERYTLDAMISRHNQLYVSRRHRSRGSTSLGHELT